MSLVMVDVDEIEVGEDRFRKKVDGIASLAESIDEVGIIEPPVVTPKDEGGYLLVAGERRMRAVKELGWDAVEVKVVKELDKLKRRQLELAENVERKDMRWHEEVEAEKRLHEISQELHGKSASGSEEGWDMKDTGKEVEKSESQVSRDLELAEAIEQFPELREKSSKRAAKREYERMKKKVADDMLADRIKKEKAPPGVINDSFQNHMKNEMESRSVDFIVADPPWGISIEDSGAVGRSEVWNNEQRGDEIFDDETSNALDLMDQMLFHCHRVLKENRHMIIFCAEQHLNTIQDMADKHFNVNNVIGVWDKLDVGRPKTYWLQSRHEIFIDISKGKREVEQGTGTVFRHKKPSNKKRIHPTQKPVSLVRELIEIYTFPGEVVLDPTMGSGSTVVAALQTGRKDVDCGIINLTSAQPICHSQT